MEYVWSFRIYDEFDRTIDLFKLNAPVFKSQYAAMEFFNGLDFLPSLVWACVDPGVWAGMYLDKMGRPVYIWLFKARLLADRGKPSNE